jgi:hypothetical protein
MVKRVKAQLKEAHERGDREDAAAGYQPVPLFLK